MISNLCNYIEIFLWDIVAAELNCLFIRIIDFQLYELNEYTINSFDKYTFFSLCVLSFFFLLDSYIIDFFYAVLNACTKIRKSKSYNIQIMVTRKIVIFFFRWTDRYVSCSFDQSYGKNSTSLAILYKPRFYYDAQFIVNRNKVINYTKLCHFEKFGKPEKQKIIEYKDETTKIFWKSLNIYIYTYRDK